MRGCLFLHMKNCGIKAKIVKTERDRQTEISETKLKVQN